MSRAIPSQSRGFSVSASLMRNASGRESMLHRALFFMFLVTLLMGGCVFRLVQLQLLQGQYNRQLADENRIRLLPVPSDRGNITDRDGKLLAVNQLSRAVYLWPRQQSPEAWKDTAERLSRILNIPAPEIIARLEQVGYDSPLPVRVSQQLSPTAFVALAEYRTQLPGVEILAGSSRAYPHRSLAAHILGYIGEATEEDMKANPDYPSGMIVGQTGIERIANAQLEGVWGSQMVEVDANGKEARMLGDRPPQSGSPVQLTIDLDVQQAAERALNNRRGAVVVLNAKTGAVLALASGPTYEPGMFTRRFSQAEWQRLQHDDQPLLNRALQGYPPGSTFKIVTAAAAMQSGEFSPNSRIGTSAAITVGGISFHEHSNSGYGVIGFREALAVSSNTFFYRLGMQIGPEMISKWANLLGIGTTSNMGLDGGSQGMVPTPEDKERLFGEPWYMGDTVSTSIGQGLVQATPLELAVMVAAIGNGGMRVQPHLLASQTNTPETKPIPTGLNPGTIQAIHSGLMAAVQQGTARRLSDGTIPLTAGKTGTAEVPGPQPNAMYVGYGPANDPEIAIAVVVENGGYGGVAAVPIAYEVFKTYFAEQGQRGAGAGIGD